MLFEIYKSERLDQLALACKSEAEPGSIDEALREQIASDYAYRCVKDHKKIFG